MQIRPINAAEAVIDAFWDQARSGFQHWQLVANPAGGVNTERGWDRTWIRWVEPAAAGPVATLTRDLALDLGAYDTVMLSAGIPVGTRLELSVQTDQGDCRVDGTSEAGGKLELAVPVTGARQLRRVTIALYTSTAGGGAAWLNWLGLQISAALPYVLAQQGAWDAEWTGYLKPADYEPTFEPSYGIVMTADELARLRQEHAGWLQTAGSTPFTKAAETARATEPERCIGEYVNFWHDTRYNRARDHDRPLLRGGPDAAVAAVIQRDPELLRLAARYALSIAACEHWDDGFICRTPGSPWEHRCFVQSLCAHEIAFVLDIAGELFTPLGRDWLLRRLVEEGLGSITYSTWRHEYIFDCNQLAWFSPGRLLALLVCERHMPRARRYIDIAVDELAENLERTILADGGYVEGPTYFRCATRDPGLALGYLARARGLDLESVVPEALRRCADFGAALVSTDRAMPLIPICDSHGGHNVEVTTVMTAILPDSHWATAYRHELAARGGLPAELLDWQFGFHIPAHEQPLPRLVILPEMGLVASHRELDGQMVKLLLLGNKAGAGHTHEDKGSFVLEFAGDTFACDPGMVDYSLALCATLKHAQRHNMLIPTGGSGRPAPRCPLPADIRAEATAPDDRQFRATVDVRPGWDGWYDAWQRHWNSPEPGSLTITDTYTLAQGDGVDFLWQTFLPVTIDGQSAVIRGRDATVTLHAPAGTTLSMDALPHVGKTQHCIRIHQPGRSGTLSVRAELALA